MALLSPRSTCIENSFALGSVDKIGKPIHASAPATTNVPRINGGGRCPSSAWPGRSPERFGLSNSMSDWASTPTPPRAAARIFVYIFIGLDSLAFGIMLPVFPRLVESFTGGNTGEAAKIMGLFTVA